MRRLALFLCLLCTGGAEAAPKLGRVPKRPSNGSPAMAVGSEFLASVAKLLNLHTPAHVHHMDDAVGRNALIDMLWTGDYTSAAGRFTDANPELASRCSSSSGSMTQMLLLNFDS